MTGDIEDKIYHQVDSSSLPLVNYAPWLLIVDEDAPDSVLDLVGAFDDVASLTLSVIDNTNPSLVSTNLVGTDLTLSYLPDQNGLAGVTVRGTAADDSYTDVSFLVRVNPINDRPVISAVTAITNEDVGTYNLDLLTASAASDVDVPDILSVSSITQVSGRAITSSQVGNSLQFDAHQFNDLAVGESETLVFDFSVSDDSGDANDTASSTLTITINGENDTPTVAAAA